MPYAQPMQTLRALCLICGLLAPAGSVLADQKDPRLDGLFASLKDVPGPGAAVAVERQIWAIWLETGEEDVAALLEAGIADMGRGRFAQALKAFDRVVEAAPGFAECWNKRATLYYFMGDYKRSLEDIARTLELEPRHFGALSGRGLVYIRLDDFESALKAFEDALAVHPQMPGPKANAEAIRKVLKEREI
ncbi:MAG: tetratricopeptide repeat protein [Hyphomicrobiales bacterium]